MIIKPNEMNFEKQKFNILIAGYPGIGKTTLALSAPKPLLLDLDKGLSRVNLRFRGMSASVQSYDELLDDLKNTDLSEFETIVIDTGARLFELMKPYAIQKNPSNGQSDGSLTLKGYGFVGLEFMRFVNSIKYNLDKHCVVIFHAKEEKDGDITKLRIMLEGGSKDNVWQPMDLGGFMEIIGKDHTIGFTTCERYFAKGSYGIKDIYTIPNPEETGKNDFLTKLIDKMYANLKANEEQARKDLSAYEKVLNEIKPQIEAMTGKTIEKVQETIQTANHCLTSEKELKNMFKNRLAEIGYKWDNEQKKYVVKE